MNYRAARPTGFVPLPHWWKRIPLTGIFSELHAGTGYSHGANMGPLSETT